MYEMKKETEMMRKRECRDGEVYEDRVEAQSMFLHSNNIRE
jgi:hypothetical protein